MAAHSEFISLPDMYLAYKKAKVDVFYEHTNHSAIEFAQYERNLGENLERLLQRLANKKDKWFLNSKIVGGYGHTPKSLSRNLAPNSDNFLFIDSRTAGSWERRQSPNRELATSEPNAVSTFRVLGDLSVDFHVISALWILKVGHLFDDKLPECAYGCRLRRITSGIDSGRLNNAALGLFKPYYHPFRLWRGRAFAAIRKSLKKRPVIALTLDLRSFYHKVSPQFLLNKNFLNSIGVKLTKHEESFTIEFIQALNKWASLTPDHHKNPSQGLPVGLSSSKLIANAILFGLDHVISDALRPIYYGRYVDDILLVLPGEKSLHDGLAVWKRIERQSQKVLRIEATPSGPPQIRVALNYARQSDLVFAGDKQKIFFLQMQRGRDLLRVIEEQISNQASEWRQLPQLPNDESGWFQNVIAASDGRSGPVDNLRKADVISVKRQKFALLLRNLEAMQRQLHPNAWKVQRKEFYRFVQNHIVTPAAIFEFVAYYFRIASLAFSCNDYAEAIRFLRHLDGIIKFLEQETTTPLNGKEFSSFRSYLAKAFTEALCKSVGSQLILSSQVSNVRRQIEVICKNRVKIPSNKMVMHYGSMLFESDLAREPYRVAITEWAGYRKSRKRQGRLFHEVPDAVNAALRLNEIREFTAFLARSPRSISEVSEWPLIFPTRPLSVGEITLLVPDFLFGDARFWTITKALRGTAPRDSILVSATKHPALWTLQIKGDGRDGNPTIALPSLETQFKSWEASAKGKPDESFTRFARIHKLLNSILASDFKPKYVVLPELSLPRRWMSAIAHGLARSGINLIAGLEYEHWGKNKVSNQVLLSIVIGNPGFYSQIQLLQEKQAAAHDEAIELANHAGAELLPHQQPPTKYLVRHKDLDFGVLICSELTDVQSRLRFRGEVDALFVVEWNKDINSFESLIEAAALDVHCYVIQSNNRMYGDCRIRVPHTDSWARDPVKTKGGISDYFVLGIVDVQTLRKFQSKKPVPKKPFKPTPDGFEICAERRVS